MGKSPIVAGATETEYSFTVELKKQTDKYLNWLFRSKCCTDLLQTGVFTKCVNPAKEITESMACVDAYRKYFSGRTEDILVCSDGSTPRTGACFAFFTGAEVYSVDPAMGCKDFSIQRLYSMKGKIQQVTVTCPVILVLPHAHVKYDDFKHLNIKGIIAMPCCVDHEIPVPPDYVYADYGIHSPKRNMQIWTSF